MQALWRYENGVLSFRDVEEPVLQKLDDVKIKVMYSTIGIQDLRMTRAWDFYAKPGIAGYEMAGIITALGDKAKAEGYYIGQHVTGTIAKFCGSCAYCLKGEENNCLQIYSKSGTICDYVVWSCSQLVPLAPETPFRIGCLLEPVAVVYNAYQKMKLLSGDNVCIFGGDFNGLLMLQFARMSGANNITVVEPKERNRLLALSLGATYVVNPADDTFETEIMKQSDFIGFQSVVITSSNTEWFQTATNIVARGGTVMVTVYYDHGQDFSINSIKFFAMNLNITSSFLYSRKTLLETKDIMSSLQLDVLINKEYPVKAALTAFEKELKHRYPRIGLIMGT